MNEWISKRRMVAEMYNKLIDKSLLKSSEDEGNYHVYHIYSIFLKERIITEVLTSKNINTGNHYPVPVIYKNHTEVWLQKNDFPQSEKIANRQISLPIYPEIKVKMIKYVAAQINKWISNIS